MDGSESPVHGDRQGSAWNGDFRSQRLHPLFVFDQFGDPERCALRPGNVHGADCREDVLRPVLARHAAAARPSIKRRVRADAACRDFLRMIGGRSSTPRRIASRGSGVTSGGCSVAVGGPGGRCRRSTRPEKRVNPTSRLKMTWNSAPADATHPQGEPTGEMPGPCRETGTRGRCPVDPLPPGGGRMPLDLSDQTALELKELFREGRASPPRPRTPALGASGR